MNSHVREYLLCNDSNLQENYKRLLESSRGTTMSSVKQNVAAWQFHTARRAAIKNGTLDRSGKIPRKQFRNEPRFI